MSFGQNTSTGSDWESSFSQILNRTQHNLNRINSRYAPGVTTSLDAGVLAPRGAVNNENMNQNSLLLDRFNKTDTYLQRPDTQRGGSASSGHSHSDPSMLERLIRIEEQNRASESATNARLSHIENNIDASLARNERASQQMKDLEQSVMQLNSKLSTVNGFIEVLQSENESKRNTISKMDHWIRQGEIWREELDDKVNTLTTITKSLDRTRTEQRELMADHATRYELEQLRDKMTVVTQQSVAASLSAWHDKMEQSVRNVERQIALLRIGMTDAGRGSLGNEALLTHDEVAAALANPLPSELLLRGTVAHEVMQMQTQLEDKLESRLQLFLKDKVDGSHNTLNRELRDKLHNLCAEMGLDYPEIELGVQYGEETDVDMSGAKARENYRIRLLEARKKSDEEIQELNRAMARVTSEIATLQQNAGVDQKHSSAVTANLERKVEECISVCDKSVATVADRSAKLETLVRETELSMRTSVTDTKSELIERLSDMAREWSTDRAGLDRRLVVNERIAEDCLDRIKLSQSAVESYFKASPDIKRFQRSADLAAQLQQQLNGVQEEVRVTANSVHKLEANSSTKNEHLELRERVARMEPTVLEKLPDYMESTKRVVDLSVVTQSRLDNLDSLSTLQHNDLKATMSKLSAVDVLATQLKGLTSVATEEVKRLSLSLTEIDSVTRKDISYLRDLTGSISSRTVALEGKVSLMNKTYAADMVNTNNSLTKLTTLTEELSANDATTRNTLVQLQWALEAEHRESADQFATLKGRLDLLHHVQHRARETAGEEEEEEKGYRRAGDKSIHIKFTTAADEDDPSMDQDQYVTTMYTSPPRTSAPSAAASAVKGSSMRDADSGSQSESSILFPLQRGAQPAQQQLPPPSSKSSTKSYSAFMTEAASLSSPEKSATREVEGTRSTNLSTSPPLREQSTDNSSSYSGADVSSRDTSGAESGFSEQVSQIDRPNLAPTPAKEGSANLSFAAAAGASASSSVSASNVTNSSVNAPKRGNSGESSPRNNNSWDDTHVDNENEVHHAANVTGDHVNMSDSRIPMQSAFDMSMPSYVSHINSSGDANDDSYRQRSDHAPSHSQSRSRSGSHSDAASHTSKLSIGSDDSLEQLNNTVSSLKKPFELGAGAAPSSSQLSGNSVPRVTPASTIATATASVTYDEKAAEADAESSSDEEESEEEHDDHSVSHSDDDHDDHDDLDAGRGQGGRGHDDGDDDDDDDDDEGSDYSDEHTQSEDDEGEEDDGDEYSRSEATSASAAGSFSQIDRPPGAAAAGSVGSAAASRGRPAVPALSMMENSWDQSNTQSSFATATSSHSQNSKDRSSISASTQSGSSGSSNGGSATKKPVGLAIPALNMSNLPTRHSDADDIPSYRSTGRSMSQIIAQQGNSSRLGGSDWDAESSMATQSAAAVSPSVSKSNSASLVPASAPLSSMNVSAADGLHMSSVSESQQRDESQLEPSRVIGASSSSAHAEATAGAATEAGVGSVVHNHSLDESTATGGSISDTSSSSSSNYTASSASYLTLNSTSPLKHTVAAPAIAASATPSSAVAPAAGVTAPRPVKASALPPLTASAVPGGSMNTSAMSKKDSIKERLKNRMNKSRAASESPSVASATPVDEVMSFEDLDDSQA